MRILTLFFFFSICMMSCKKSSTVEVSKNLELISRQSWKLTSLRISTNNGPWVDGLATLSPCQLDNLTIFHSDYTYTLDEGQTKCNNTDPQVIQNGSWSFSAGETKLTTTYNGIVYTTTDISLLDEQDFKTIKRDTTGTDITVVETHYIH